MSRIQGRMSQDPGGRPRGDGIRHRLKRFKKSKKISLKITTVYVDNPARRRDSWRTFGLPDPAVPIKEFYGDGGVCINKYGNGA